MKHLVIHLAIALAMFTVGTATHTLFSVRSDSEIKAHEVAKSRAQEESKIIEAVFRRQIGEDSSSSLNAYAPPGTFLNTYTPFTASLPNTYYLSCYNYADPPDQIMARLAFAREMRVRRLSELPLDDHVQSGQGRIFIRVGSIRWISANEVIVGGSCRYGWNAAQAYVYHVVREKGVWRVMSSETIS
ncbi:MAG TPA: hypothetical protein VF708_13030 [Pyrinomonadaceae bacterium]|jgi:hypothetical protein